MIKMSERKTRICPVCGHQFKPMTDNQWRTNLTIHLSASVRHNFMNIDEAMKIVEKSQ